MLHCVFFCCETLLVRYIHPRPIFFSPLLSLGLHGSDALAPRNICLNLLLTHVNLKGALGISVIGSSSPMGAGGICETYYRRTANGLQALNVAVSTSASTSGGVSAWTHLIATAHELGRS